VVEHGVGKVLAVEDVKNGGLLRRFRHRWLVDTAVELHLLAGCPDGQDAGQRNHADQLTPIAGHSSLVPVIFSPSR
jgi:hypothetical protein